MGGPGLTPAICLSKARRESLDCENEGSVRPFREAALSAAARSAETAFTVTRLALASPPR
ncbi:conserved hypothetical protein [Xanthomonas phaseoli pv. phaseoli]|uniref:Secreted protein n=1 Tax=Xanthomonas campestris pv. phaseoli TaxID=317013 RepID=A0ABY1TL44_XANCH|nr:conserved hypothetical protein [Xanthomonas phaseoli pv. phaseoli]